MPLSLLLVSLFHLAAASHPPNTVFTHSRFSQERPKRSSEHIIDDCMVVTSEPGQYYFKSSGLQEGVCGVYITADQDKVVEVLFNYLDVPCSSSLVAFVDGWELGGGFFPRTEDASRPLSDRVSEFCGAAPPRRVFLSSQNAALIQYKVPKRSRGFSFRINFITNPNPCNVLLSDEGGVFTLHNFGRPSNCSLTALFPMKVTVLSLAVGGAATNTGTLLKCRDDGGSDYLQLGGGSDLGLPNIETSDTVCGLDPVPGRVMESLLCGVSTVRLVSSGRHDNAVTLSVHQFTDRDMDNPTFTCTN